MYGWNKVITEICFKVTLRSDEVAKHIENAILMTLDTINESVAKDVINSKDSYVIVYCRSGNRSKQAQELLNKLGYTNVYTLGSINNWQG